MNTKEPITTESEKRAQQHERMTTAPVSRLILTLGLPSTVSMLITNIYNMADTFFVGQEGTSASGAVGIVFGIMAILQAVGFLFGHGGGCNVSMRLGARDDEGANRIASVAVFGSFTVGLVLAVAGLALLNPLLRLMGSTVTILPYARQYATCIFASAPFITASFTINNILRYEGKAALGMVGMGIGAVLNMAGDPILMFGCKLGVLGAGLSTAFSQVVGFSVLLVMFQSRRSQCHFAWRYVRSTLRELKAIVPVGFPSLVRQGLSSVATMVLNGQAALYGDAAVAAMSIVGRLGFFIFSVGLGIGQGCQPVVGFNYGARKYSRVRSAFKFTVLMGEGCIAVAALVCLCFSQHIVGLFRNDPQVIAVGSLALVFQCLSIMTQPLPVCTNMLLQCVGKSWQASVTALMRSGLFFIPLVLLLPPWLGILGVQLAQPISDALSCLGTVPFLVSFFKHLPKQDGVEP